ncbi:class I SAM-dependent methyltransferase [Sedimenticola hydrogenitrophicus]|uniref:class I SAM-dependent methyltransferase n=1 Tax=Sedimenticola hydrogenitrophicus TaxID=2967975 RepID=UPI0021A7013F|nr:methyltransferase domain-containing protein [Sedimenticola hydrogenitrophicus]
MKDNELLAKWDSRHAEAESLGRVATVLEQNIHLATAGCRALDLACGRGANALFMATSGLEVTAWDLSPVAIGRLERAAGEQGLVINTAVRDVIAIPPEPRSFDLILVSFFLERSLAPVIAAALRPGGLLFYQTYSRVAVSDEGPSSEQFRLDDNELLTLFPTLKVRVYREERLLGDTRRGWRNMAMLVAQRV